MVSADGTILATVFSIGVLWNSPSFVLVSLTLYYSYTGLHALHRICFGKYAVD